MMHPQRTLPHGEERKSESENTIFSCHDLDDYEMDCIDEIK